MPTRFRALAAVMAALLAFAAIQYTASVGAQVQRGATMTVLRGEVAVVHADGSAIQPAPSGTTVDTGDQIRTLNKAGSLITFFSGTEIEMGADTILEVREITRSGDRVNVSLEQVAGVTLNRVQSLVAGSSYQIDAGGALAVVRGTTFALAGPTSTSQGNIVTLACLEDCGPSSVFGGCAMQPFMGIGVTVANGKQTSGCETWAIGRNEGYFDAAISGITTAEQAFTSGNPGQQVLGNATGTGPQNESNSHTDRDEEREEDENSQQGNTGLFAVSPPLIAPATPTGTPTPVGPTATATVTPTSTATPTSTVIPRNATTLSVSCTSPSLVVCTAIVTDISSAPTTPTGTVTITVSGSAPPGTQTCTLAPDPISPSTTARCSANFVFGTLVSAAYSGDATHQPATFP